MSQGEKIQNEIKTGDQYLVEDLENLLLEAKNGEFGDFANKKYATPKIELRNQLLGLAKNVVNGKYD